MTAAPEPIRVLLVEDDEDDYVITRDLLCEAETARFVLDWVPGYDPGRDAILAGRHDVYLLDYRLGGRSGLELLREVTGLGADGPFILLTGHGSREVDVEASNAGAASYLVKRMLDGPGLERTIRYALGIKRAERARLHAEHVAGQHARLADIGAITARIVHDLGNPLAAITMQVRLLIHKATREPEGSLSHVRPMFDQLLLDIDRLRGLVREFLEFSRDQRLQRQAVDVGAFLGDVVRAWQGLAAARDVTLRLDAPAHLPPLYADAAKLRRVMENLVKNALEAIDRGPGTIDLRVVCRDGTGVSIRVEDTGPGIPSGMDPFRLFETSKPEGTGLGLPIVREIVMAHGGAIVHQAREPHGACFEVTLPLRPGS